MTNLDPIGTAIECIKKAMENVGDIEEDLMEDYQEESYTIPLTVKYPFVEAMIKAHGSVAHCYEEMSAIVKHLEQLKDDIENGE